MIAAGDVVVAWPPARLAARVALLLMTFVGVERWVIGIAALPAAAYERPFLAMELVRASLDWPAGPIAGLVRVLGCVGLGYAAIRHGRALSAAWRDIDEGDVLRWVVAAPLVILAWVYATQDINLFFGQSHMADRLLLILLAAAALWRPVFLLPFALLVVAFSWQLNYPIGGFSVAEEFLLLKVILLTASYLLLRTVGLRLSPSDLILVVFAAIASHYFIPGAGKLRIGWFSFGAVPLLLPATHLNGWLGFLSTETIGELTTRLLTIDPLFVMGAVVVEACAVFALVRRRLLIVYLLMWSGFHLSVFAFSGIFFWKWILFEWTLLALLVRRADRAPLAIFSPAHAALSVALIASGAIWFRPVDLSWYNSAANYGYQFEAVTDGGDRSWLSPKFFAPYDYQFTMTNFSFLSPEPQLGIAWGAAYDRSMATALIKAETPDDFTAVERARGEVRYDSTRVAELDAFVIRFVATWNDQRSKRTALSVLPAPRRLWTTEPEGAFDLEGRIDRVNVYRTTSFFDGTRVHHLNRHQLRSLHIPVDRPAGSLPPA